VGGREKGDGMPRKLKTPSGVINIRVSKGPPRPEVVVLPWLDVRKPIKVGRIHFVPLAEAVATLGPQVGARLQELTGNLQDAFGRSVNPTIALRDCRPRVATGHIAPPGPFIRPIEKLFFVATLYNCLCQGKVYGNANAETFHFFYQGLGGTPGGGAYSIPRRYGTIGGMAQSRSWVTVRPMHCGQFEALDDVKRTVLQALVTCKDPYVDKSLHLFYAASKDGGDPEAELVLLDAAFEALLRASSKTNTKWRELLTAFDSDLKVFVRKNLWSAMLGARWMLRDRRDLAVHPYKHEAFTWRLPRHKNVPEMAIYERCYIALMLAYLVDMGVLERSLDISTLVVGTEIWLRDANDDFCVLRSAYVKRQLVVREMSERGRAALAIG
jgi:hypothetical protein